MERKNMLTEKANDLPRMKFKGKASRRGLNSTLNSHIFFINRSVQVSVSAKTVDLTAATSN